MVLVSPNTFGTKHSAMLLTSSIIDSGFSASHGSLSSNGMVSYSHVSISSNTSIQNMMRRRARAGAGTDTMVGGAGGVTGRRNPS